MGLETEVVSLSISPDTLPKHCTMQQGQKPLVVWTCHFLLLLKFTWAEHQVAFTGIPVSGMNKIICWAAAWREIKSRYYIHDSGQPRFPPIAPNDLPCCSTGRGDVTAPQETLQGRQLIASSVIWGKKKTINRFTKEQLHLLLLPRVRWHFTANSLHLAGTSWIFTMQPAYHPLETTLLCPVR